MNRAEASRHNGAKSKGPVTPEGTQKSARNSTSHGLFSSEVVAANESREAFEGLLADYLRRYAPEGEAEKDLVEEIAAARWRMRRIARMEAALLNEAIRRQTELLEAEGQNEPERAESIALSEIAAEGRGLTTLHRYENRLRRQYEKALAELTRLQAGRPGQQQPQPQQAPETTKRTRDTAGIESLIARFIEPPPVRRTNGSGTRELLAHGDPQPTSIGRSPSL
jgi:hypothetical protein